MPVKIQALRIYNNKRINMTQEFGKNTINQGERMKVEMKNFERSTHNLGKLWKSTMAPGVIVPFWDAIVLPGDKKEISLGALVNTHPTIGPLFGKFRLECNIFVAPIRLYQPWLQFNKPKIGMKMETVKLPLMKIVTQNYSTIELGQIQNVDTYQINPSCILAYIGVRGIGTGNINYDTTADRDYQAVKLLMYHDVCYQYYFNKQEDNAYVIHTEPVPPNRNVTQLQIDGVNIPIWPVVTPAPMDVSTIITVTYTGTLNDNEILILLDNGLTLPVNEIGILISNTGTVAQYSYKWQVYGNRVAQGWKYPESFDTLQTEIELTSFPIENIMEMRERIMGHVGNTAPFYVTQQDLTPYSLLFKRHAPTGYASMMYNMEGLCVKTYDSDILQNFINKEWIDGAGGISEVTAISTVGNSFTIDTLNLAEKLYDMLNRIGASDGTYTSWISVVYSEAGIKGIISPIFVGGLVKDIVFDEVVSTTESPVGEAGSQPLGTLAGKGVMGRKHIGGDNITIQADEISYAMGFVTITPIIDYAQGNKYDVEYKTMDDFHKPSLDGIGFQDSLNNWKAHWDDYQDNTGEWKKRAMGKIPAWMWYRTSINEVYGNFAIRENQGWMILNRNYDWEIDNGAFKIKDLTTYIDPRKFNNIFAQTSLDSMNFWVQINIEDETRRKITARLIPNLM